MTQPSLEKLEETVVSLAQAVPAVMPYLPTFGYSQDGARPHLEVNTNGYNYVVVERGVEIKRITTLDLDEACYWAFKASTFSVASKLSVVARDNAEDPRRQLFEIHVDLIGRISQAWAAQLRNFYSEVLKKAPFDDNAFVRANRTRELHEQGLSDDTAWNTALKEYPPHTFPTAAGGFRRKLSSD